MMERLGQFILYTCSKCGDECCGRCHSYTYDCLCQVHFCEFLIDMIKHLTN